MSWRQRTTRAPPWHSRVAGVAAIAASPYAQTAGGSGRAQPSSFEAACVAGEQRAHPHLAPPHLSSATAQQAPPTCQQGLQPRPFHGLQRRLVQEEGVVEAAGVGDERAALHQWVAVVQQGGQGVLHSRGGLHQQRHLSFHAAGAGAGGRQGRGIWEGNLPDEKGGERTSGTSTRAAAASSAAAEAHRLCTLESTPTTPGVGCAGGGKVAQPAVKAFHDGAAALRQRADGGGRGGGGLAAAEPLQGCLGEQGRAEGGEAGRVSMTHKLARRGAGERKQPPGSQAARQPASQPASAHASACLPTRAAWH